MNKRGNGGNLLMNTAVKMTLSGERYFIQCKFFLLLICIKLTSVALLRRIRTKSVY